MMSIEQNLEMRWRESDGNGREAGVAKRAIFRTLLAAAVLTSSALIAAPQGNLPEGPSGGDPVVVGGTVVPPVRTADALTINQTSARVALDWGHFDTQPGNSVIFNQPGGRSDVAVNRIVGGNGFIAQATEFMGTLTAPGHVFIINPYGVVFGSGAAVNVGALLATSATPNNLTAFVNGSDTLQFRGGNYAGIINRGEIRVGPGGFAVLAGPYVENDRLVEVDGPAGQVELLSSTQFDVDISQRGDGLVRVYGDGGVDADGRVDRPESVTGGQGELGVTNTPGATLRSPSGNIYLTANMVRDQILNQAVNFSGVADADAFASAPGGGSTIMVVSAGDITFANATVRAVAEGTTADAAQGDDAAALIAMEAGRDLSFEGTMTARAVVNDGLDDPSGHITEAASSTRLIAGRDLSLNGDVSVDSQAVTLGSYARSDAQAQLYAGRDVNRVGDLGVVAKSQATDPTTPEESAASDATATLEVLAGRDNNGTGQLTSGNIDIAGDSRVRADGLMVPGDGIADQTSANATADASVLAPGNVNVSGDFDVNANAQSFTAFHDTANATARLAVVAGATRDRFDTDQLTSALIAQDDLAAVFDLNNADLRYAGSLSVGATALAEGVSSSNTRARAVGALAAGDDVDVSLSPGGAADPVAAKADVIESFGTTESGAAQSNAAMMLTAGLSANSDASNITVQGGVGSRAHANHPSAGTGTSINQGTELDRDPSRIEDATALTALVIEGIGSLGVSGPDPRAQADTDPLPLSALATVAGQETKYQLCRDGSCGAETAGIGPFSDPAIGVQSQSLAQLIVQEAGSPPRQLSIVLLQPPIEPIDPAFPGPKPLNFPGGFMDVADSVGATLPPETVAFGGDMRDSVAAALRAGEDPTTILPAPAAGAGLLEGQDDYSLSRRSFCDQLVSGGCLGQAPSRETPGN